MTLANLNAYPITWDRPESGDDDAHGLGPLKAGWMETAPGGSEQRWTINQMIAGEGPRPLPAGARAFLAGLGWDGTALTSKDIGDMHLRGLGVKLEALLEIPGATQPSPSPVPDAPTDASLFESIFPIGHELSAKLPKGTRARRAVGAFETMWGFSRHFWELAAKEGIAGIEAVLKPARDAALVLYTHVIEAWQNGEDRISGAALDEAQAAMDNYWNAVHEARRRCFDAKASGYEMYPGDPRPSSFQNSLLNRLAWRALANMTTAAGLYGLRGELRNGQREAEYVNAFESFDQQDPLRPQVLGSAGIHIADQLPG